MPSGQLKNSVTGGLSYIEGAFPVISWEKDEIVESILNAEFSAPAEASVTAPRRPGAADFLSGSRQERHAITAAREAQS